MMGAEASLRLALQAARAYLGAKADVFEIFVRLGKTWRLAQSKSREKLKEEAYEFGVACRCQRYRQGGFAAASGSPKAAAETAAKLSLASLSDGHPPLPDATLLGAAPTPEPQWLSPEVLQLQLAILTSQAVDSCAVSLVHSQTLFSRSEGFTASWQNQLLLVEWEQELLPGIACSFHRVLAPPWRFQQPSWQGLLPQGSPGPLLPAGRHLARVLLSPDVAAPLLVSLARRSSQPFGVVAPAWQLSDLRTGERAFLPMACDGEGLPSENRLLLPGARLSHPLRGNEGSGSKPLPHGLVPPAPTRVPWDRPPQPSPVHLWQQTSTSEPLQTLLPQLEDVFLVLAPVSELALEKNGQFRLLTVLARVRHGKLYRYGVGVLRGSLKRLVSGLLGAFGPPEHVALGCVVSTPWLLISNFEVTV
ncbi:MAG: hypothetical protein ACUVRY_08265 [Thermoanaerobaculaceae bacterium]